MIPVDSPTKQGERTQSADTGRPVSRPLGPIGRLGRWAATHRRAVFGAWAVLVVVLGAFAPNVEKALSGAGWQASSSESVVVRDLVEREFGGLSSSSLQVVLHSETQATSAPAFRERIAAVTGVLDADTRVSQVVPPAAGTTISRDGRTAIVTAGAAGDPNEMVRAADDLKEEVRGLGDEQIEIALTGAWPPRPARSTWVRSCWTSRSGR